MDIMSRMITQSQKTANGVDLRTPPLPEPPNRVTVGKLPHVVTIVCVWNRSPIYGITYVENLFNMVARHCPIPFDFVCITPHDVPEGVIRMSPPAMAEGWWNKVGLFSPDLFGPSKRILYLDLDVIIINSLEEILSADDPFCMIENFGPNKGHAAHNSSCMLWTPTEKTAEIFTRYSPDVSRELHGDQCWIWRVMQDENIRDFERHQCVSFKYGRQNAAWNWETSDTAVVVFHGQPKPHNCGNAKLMQTWSGAQ
jgi:hypothetical protein